MQDQGWHQVLGELLDSEGEDEGTMKEEIKIVMTSVLGFSRLPI